MKYYLGCSGWYYNHWKDLFYKGLPQKEWFSHYAKVFNTVELNSTFYHFPKPAVVKTWYQQAPKDFVYSIKVNRVITHMKKFKGCKRLISDFYKAADELKEKLGCVLFQLPPNLHYKPEKLEEIVSQMDPSKKNVLEFRHESWWNKEVYEVLKDRKIIFCIVSSPTVPDDFVKTADDIYVRFHGHSWYDYNYGKKELKEFASKIKKSRAKNAWVYFNNDYNAYAVKNCLELKKILKA